MVKLYPCAAKKAELQMTTNVAQKKGAEIRPFFGTR
jgi:hypothetical protein